MQACGLKRLLFLLLFFRSYVTPHAGVWIETTCGIRQQQQALVTPHAGVWIETLFQKHLSSRFFVTPHAGVWIET